MWNETEEILVDLEFLKLTLKRKKMNNEKQGYQN